MDRVLDSPEKKGSRWCLNRESIPGNIYDRRHGRWFSSWSMFDEPHISKEYYMQAEVVVPAHTKEDALELLAKEDMWNIDEMRRIEPRILPVDQPTIMTRCLY